MLCVNDVMWCEDCPCHAVPAPAVGIGESGRRREDGVVEGACARRQRVTRVVFTGLLVEAQRVGLLGVQTPLQTVDVEQTGRGRVILHGLVRGGGDEVRAEPQAKGVHKEHGAKQTTVGEADSPLVLRGVTLGFPNT